MKKATIILNIDNQISEYIKKSLENDGYSVILRNKNIDKTACDILISDETDISKMNSSTPKIILSKKETKDNIEDTIYYIKSPFAFQDLINLIKKILDNNLNTSEEINIDTLKIDIKDKKVYRSNRLITLTKKEYILLTFLAKNKDKAVSRAELLDHVWGMQIDPFSNTVEAHVFSIRKKIDRGEPIKLVHTIPKYGYKVSIEK